MVRILYFLSLITLFLSQPLSAREVRLMEDTSGPTTERPSTKNSQSVSVYIEHLDILSDTAYYENGVIYIEEGESAEIIIDLHLTKPYNMATGIGNIHMGYRDSFGSPAGVIPDTYSPGGKVVFANEWVGGSELWYSPYITIDSNDFPSGTGWIFAEYESGNGLGYKSSEIKVVVLEGNQNDLSSSSSSSSSRRSSRSSSSSVSSSSSSSSSSNLPPVARCYGSTIANSPNLIGKFYDSGSYSVSGTRIVSRRWVMQGISGYAQADQYTGAGPITVTLFGGTPTSAEIHATLTVTDELGKSSSITCMIRR